MVGCRSCSPVASVEPSKVNSFPQNQMQVPSGFWVGHIGSPSCSGVSCFSLRLCVFFLLIWRNSLYSRQKPFTIFVSCKCPWVYGLVSGFVYLLLFSCDESRRAFFILKWLLFSLSLGCGHFVSSWRRLSLCHSHRNIPCVLSEVYFCPLIWVFNLPGTNFCTYF